MSDLNNNYLPIIGVVVNTITIPLIIYFIKSVFNRLDKIESKMEQVSSDINAIVNRVVVMETQCAIRHAKGKK